MTISPPPSLVFAPSTPAAGPPSAAETERWIRCRGCHTTIYHPRLRRELHVCPECGHHHRINALTRLEQLLDPGSWRPAGRQVRAADPLRFVDSRPYVERLADARRRTGLTDAIVWGRGRIEGNNVVLAVMDFGFLGGSMGSAVGEAVTRAAEEALAERTPLVLVITSGGARMQEGGLSLMQMAKTGQAMSALHQAGVLSIGVLADPTYGGVTASFATLADVLIGERGAMIGFAGPRVIEAATRERLPAGFQTAEFLHSAGLLDRVETRRGLLPLLGRLLGTMAARRTARPACQAGGRAHGAAGRRRNGAAGARGPRTAAETLRLARDIARPTTLDYLGMVCDDFVELHGDRGSQDDPALVGGLAVLDGRPIMMIGHQKGHDTAQLVARNFGMPQPQGYRKAIRLMRLADRLGLPVVTLVDTQGAAPGVAAERHGQAWAIAECIATMADLRVPVVSLITGEGGSGGALALAVANEVLMSENACYSVISPESCSTILHGDPSHAAEMAEALRLTAPELIRLGVADGIVAEPGGGAQADHEAAGAAVKAALLAALARFETTGPDQCRAHRQRRFRDLGVIEHD